MENLIKIRSHTVTLVKDESEYKVHGTGVLIRLKKFYLILSAAHVFDDYEKLSIPLEKGKFMFKPGGEIIINSPEISREKDDLDIGILILDEVSVKELKTSYDFLEEDNILINHNFQENNQYLLFGFPSTWSKKSYTRNSFHVRPFFHPTNPVNISEYSKFNRENYLNIIVEYNRNKTINLKSKSLSFGPNLFGMSGCGLWELVNFPQVNLVAIMTDWPKENRKRIIGTRMDLVTEVLRNHFDLDVTESNLIGLK